MPEPIVIVGAGEAGVAAADALRAADFDGEIVLINGEATLPYERPPLSKDLILGTQPEPTPIRKPEWFDDKNIDLRNSSWVHGIDPVAHQLEFVQNGIPGRIGYSKLLLATGTRARGFETASPVMLLRTFEDGLRIRARLEEAETVAVIGGGVIGLELAAAASQLGKSVRVFEIAPRLMGRVFPPEISGLVEQLHRDAGVELNLGVTSVVVGPDTVRIDGEAVKADLFVAGVGALPNSQVAVLAGCTIESGIVVDGQCQTDVPDIYAAGDVASFVHPLIGDRVRIETWQHAQRHGAHAGRAMLSHQQDYAEVPWFWTDQFGVNFQACGFGATAPITYWRAGGRAGQQTAFHFNGDRLMGATTINNGRDMRPATRLVSASWQGSGSKLTDSSVALGTIVGALI